MKITKKQETFLEKELKRYKKKRRNSFGDLIIGYGLVIFAIVHYSMGSSTAALLSGELVLGIIICAYGHFMKEMSGNKISDLEFQLGGNSTETIDKKLSDSKSFKIFIKILWQKIKGKL
jgi:hypothetical protein